MFRSVVQSREGSNLAYVESLRTANQNLAVCTGCRPLERTGSVDCAAIQTAVCEADIVYATSDVESVEAALVSGGAPSSLEAQDALLQRDLARADSRLLSVLIRDWFPRRGGRFIRPSLSCQLPIHTGGSRRWAREAASRPVTSTSLLRERRPATRLTADRRTPTASATAWMSSRLAAPSMARAWIRTCRTAPSQTARVREEPG